jgi:hypothetical protein
LELHPPVFPQSLDLFYSPANSHPASSCTSLKDNTFFVIQAVH